MIKSIKYNCPEPRCKYEIILNIQKDLIKDKKEFGIPAYICPCVEMHDCFEPNSVGLNIMLQF